MVVSDANPSAVGGDHTRPAYVRVTLYVREAQVLAVT